MLVFGFKKNEKYTKFSDDASQQFIHPLATWRQITALLLLSFLIISSQAYAGFRDLTEFQFDLGSGNTHISWLPGEAYDTFSGRLEHQMVDLNYEGNGSLPIRVVRQYSSLGSSGEFGEMSLVIPRISFMYRTRDRGTPDYNLCEHYNFNTALNSRWF